MTTITIKDETTSGKILAETTLALSDKRVTVREIITQRVCAEVASDFVNRLVKRQSPSSQAVDVDAQVRVACEAFENGGFLMLVNDQQVESLDESIELADDVASSASFVRLVPLVGG